MKTLLTLALALVANFGFAQNILLVDNSPTAPTGAHVFASLQAAIDATSPGDIIHVKPSNVSYGNATISQANDSISIFGIGIKPDKDILLRSIVGRLDIEGFNIRVSGFEVTDRFDIGNNTADDDVGNVQIENCWFTSSQGIDAGAGSPETVSNLIIRNCILNTIQIGPGCNGTVVTNSIIYFSTTTTTGPMEATNGTLITHCLFYGPGSASNFNSFSNISNSTISNCIFYGRSPNASSTNANNTWNNNYAEQSYDDSFGFNGANGNTVNNTVPTITGNLFADPGLPNPPSGLVWNVNWDPALDPTDAAALVNAGDDLTDVGLSGGTIPFSTTGTPLPYIKSLIVPSIIKQGNDLDVSINALGN